MQMSRSFQIASATFATVTMLHARTSWGQCAAAPSGSCRHADTSRLSIVNSTDDTRDKLTLKFINADSTTVAELSDPTASTTYLLCTYTDDTLLDEVSIPGGGSCSGSPCWSERTGKGYIYKDKATSTGGISRIILKAGSATNASISLKGAGTNLAEVSLPLAEPITVELHNASTGVCFSATFSGDDVATNNAASGKFQAKTGRDTTSPFDKFYNITSLSYEGDYVVIRTTDLPDHGSPFYPTSDPRYEPYNGDNPNFSTAINLMGMISDPDLAEQDITFRIPRNPTAAATPQATGFGPIGIGINGVVFFNQYNGVGALLNTLEFNNTDQYNGHPTPAPSLQYHYHLEPLWLTSSFGRDALVGYLLDGFPVYGPVENGTVLTSGDLDECHGHEHATADYPDGIYHYHFTDDAPWLNGDGYHGTPGTVTQ
jgi:hypothetical protein